MRNREENKITPAGLYVNIPFCIARCAFCAFNVQGYRTTVAKRYAAALQQEIALQTARDRDMVSIYLGGGTPTLYPPETLNTLVQACHGAFHVMANAEITVEAHPATIDKTYLKGIRAAGINRLSIGAQSFSDTHLTRLGRHHTVADLYQAYDAARKAGFENIGMDLIYALPDQTLREWEKTLQTAIALDPDHLSIYGLSIEEGTLFYKQGMTLSSEEDQIILYQLAQQMLEDAGFLQYEISNFTKAGYASVHNLLYWDRGEIRGVGVSAHAYTNHEHRANTASLMTYMQQVEAGRFPVDFVQRVSIEEEQMDRILFGLRKTEGIPAEWLFPEQRRKVIPWIEADLLAERDGQIFLTPKGMLMADEIAVALL